MDGPAGPDRAGGRTDAARRPAARAAAPDQPRPRLRSPTGRGSPTACWRPPPPDAARPTCRSSGCRGPAFGPAPVDPATVGAHELLRVASVLVADDLVALGADPYAPPGRGRGAARFRLVGDPAAGDGPARAPARPRPARGRTPPPRRRVGAPLDELLAHTWTQRCFEHGSKPWAEWLRFWRERDQLPARVDLADSVGAGTRGARSSGSSPTTTACPARSAYGPCRRCARPRGRPGRARTPGRRGRRAAGAGRRAAVADADAAAADPGQRRRPGRRTRSRAGVGGRLRGPVTRHLTRAGYPVVGDLADLAPRSAPAPVTRCRRRAGRSTWRSGWSSTRHGARERAGGAVSRRVLLHVGCPKTGTSYLQDVLLPQPVRCCASTTSSTPPTASTPTSSPRST